MKIIKNVKKGFLHLCYREVVFGVLMWYMCTLLTLF